MAGTQSEPVGPDLARGIPAADLVDGRMLAGHVGDEAVLLARRGTEVSPLALPAPTTADRSRTG
jgi:hypothetical protein